MSTRVKTFAIGFVQAHPALHLASSTAQSATSTSTHRSKWCLVPRRRPSTIAPSSTSRRNSTPRASATTTDSDDAAEVPIPSGDDEQLKEGEIHNSWSVYTEPGNKCVICLGRGYSKCLFCYGKGKIRIGPQEGRDTVDCSMCGGTAKEFCLRCDGSGIRPSFRYELNENLELEIVDNLTNEEVCNMPTQAEVEAQEAKEAQEKQQDATAASS